VLVFMSEKLLHSLLVEDQGAGDQINEYSEYKTDSNFSIYSVSGF
jgi:hypothetical protein